VLGCASGDDASAREIAQAHRGDVLLNGTQAGCCNRGAARRVIGKSKAAEDAKPHGERERRERRRRWQYARREGARKNVVDPAR